jgi:YD repeat-containing protein
VSETAGSAGGVVRQVRDQTGRIIEVTLDRAGQVTATRVLQGVTRP